MLFDEHTPGNCIPLTCPVGNLKRQTRFDIQLRSTLRAGIEALGSRFFVENVCLS